MDDVFAILDRTKEQISELRREYLSSINNQLVTPRAKVITHQVIESLSNVLDQTALKLWKKEVSPALTESERKTVEKNVYFPVGNNEQSFKSSLGKWGKLVDGELSGYLLKWQPFIIKDDWLDNLKKIARQKHIGLVPQKVTSVTHIEYSSNAGTVHIIAENIKFGPGVSILGAPIDPNSQRIVPTEGVKEEVDQWKTFILEGYDLDALSFIEGSLERVEEMTKEAQNKFDL